MPRIYVLSGPDLGRSFDVEDGATLGRAPDGDVVLRDASVSRAHARLERTDAGWRVIDLRSRNGLYRGGQRVPHAELADADEFQLGEVLMRFRIEPDARTLEATRVRPPPAPAKTETAALEFVPGGGAGAGAAGGGIELEGAWSDGPALPARVPDPATSARAQRMAAAGIGARPATVDRGVLQYNKVEQRESLWYQDFGEQPLWLRALVLLVAAALAAGLAWLAFRGVLLVRENVSGS